MMGVFTLLACSEAGNGMWWELWGKTLFSGFAGSVVGLVGAVVAVFFGRWLERRAEDDKRLRESAAVVAGKVFNLSSPVMNKPVDGLGELTDGLFLIGAEASPRFPQFASWCYYHGALLLRHNEWGKTDEFKNVQWDVFFGLTSWYGSKKLVDFEGDWQSKMEDLAERLDGE